MTAIGERVVDLHRSFTQVYHRDCELIAVTWRAMSPEQRVRAMLAGVPDDAFLKHSADESLGVACLVIPEFNLKDLKDDPEALLGHLKFRARPLIEQYEEVDALHMEEAIRANPKRLRRRGAKEDTIVVFHDKQYGATYQPDPRAPASEMRQNFTDIVAQKWAVTHNHGLWILHRQSAIFAGLEMLMSDIMEHQRESKGLNVAPKSREDSTPKIASLASSSSGTTWESVAQHISAAADYCPDHLDLLKNDAAYLRHYAGLYHLSQPGVIEDLRGKQGVDNSQRGISGRIFELLSTATVSSANWQYLLRLVSDNNITPSAGGKLLQSEIWAAARDQLGYEIPSCTGCNSGPGPLEEPPADTIFHEEKGTANKCPAVPSEYGESDNDVYFKKHLDDLQTLQASDKELPNLNEGVTEALAELLLTVGLCSQLRSLLPRSVIEKKSQQVSQFCKTTKGFLLDVAALRKDGQCDLFQFASPIGNLSNPEAASGCIAEWDHFVETRCGGKDRLSTAMVEAVKKVHGKNKKAVEQNSKRQAEDDTQHVSEALNSLTIENTVPDILQRKTKIKTRGVPAEDNSNDNFTSTTENKIEDSPIFLVSQKIYNTFATLFRLSSDRNLASKLPWLTFIHAMTSRLQFMCEAVGGSVYIFQPGVPGWQPVSFHRPHPKDIFDHWAMARVKRRLERKFGISIANFRVGSLDGCDTE